MLNKKVQKYIYLKQNSTEIVICVLCRVVVAYEKHYKSVTFEAWQLTRFWTKPIFWSWISDLLSHCQSQSVWVMYSQSYTTSETAQHKHQDSSNSELPKSAAALCDRKPFPMEFNKMHECDCSYHPYRLFLAMIASVDYIKPIMV